MVYISRKEHFNAAHKLYNPAWSKEQNEAVFGPCANENWHGHNFQVIVTVKGMPNPETSFVIDLKLLSKIIRENIIDKVDHKNLDLDVDFLRGKMTSCETIVVEFWKILSRELAVVAPSVSLHCIELHETERNFVRYFGEAIESYQ